MVESLAKLMKKDLASSHVSTPDFLVENPSRITDRLTTAQRSASALPVSSSSSSDSTARFQAKAEQSTLFHAIEFSKSGAMVLQSSEILKSRSGTGTV